MKALTIRNVPESVARRLEIEKGRRGTSLNQTVLELLAQALGLSGRPIHNGLAALAGGWTEDDVAAMDEATEIFDRVDPELWR